MRVNWRSDRPLVRALNHLLAPADVFAQPGVDYVDVTTPDVHAEPRLRFSSGPKAALRICLVTRHLVGAAGGDRQGAAPEQIPKAWGQSILPQHVAEDIAQLLGAGALVREEGNRPWRSLQPGDIAVLVRKNRQARSVQQCLLQVGIPAVIHGAGSVFSSHEATAMQRLLDALVRPADETTARTLAVGPLFGMSANSLAVMDEADWDNWLAKLHAWSELWRTSGLMSAMRRLMAEEGVPARLLAQPGGERAMTNVLHLAELLHAAAWSERLGPVALCGWLRRKRLSTHVDTGVDSEQEQLRLETDEHAVQIVTVHRSKGLQYPVVFAPYLWDAGPGRGEMRHVKFHDTSAGDVLSVDISLCPSLEPKLTSIALAERERQTEALRLAYVALTRACHLGVVYWGAFSGAEASPLASVLHGPREASEQRDRLTATQQRFPALADAAILAELQALAEGAEGAIEVAALEPLQGRTWTAPTGDTAQTRTLSFERTRIDRTWGRGSFTRMVGGACTSHEGDPASLGVERHPNASVDATWQTASPTPPVPSDASDVPLAKFPVGADAGTFLHAALEHCDFTSAGDSAALALLLRSQMRLHGVEETWEPTLVHALQQIVHTPLGADCADLPLCAIPMADRLNELRFDMPVAGGYEVPSSREHVDAERVACALQSHASADSPIAQAAERVRGLSFRLRGFLTGAIDLVFRARIGGTMRFFVADYKSNWLGERHRGTGERLRSCVDHYHPGRIARVMQEHHYVLQAHIYAVALHRYLRWRLGTAYDYDKHFGGVVYLFLRGMLGRGTPRDERGRPYGVHFELPPASRIEALNNVLSGPLPTGRVT
jgi:exodeoxyribonuclease V beta subunit